MLFLGILAGGYLIWALASGQFAIERHIDAEWNAIRVWEGKVQRRSPRLYDEVVHMSDYDKYYLWLRMTREAAQLKGLTAEQLYERYRS